MIELFQKFLQINKTIDQTLVDNLIYYLNLMPNI